MQRCLRSDRPELSVCLACSHDAGARICWEEHGEGDPLLLIMGLGATLEWWNRLMPSLIAALPHDRRSTTAASASSDVPPGPYSIPQMADDARGGARRPRASPRRTSSAMSMGGYDRAGARAPPPGAGPLARARLHQLRRPRGGAGGARGRVRDGRAREDAARRRDVGMVPYTSTPATPRAADSAGSARCGCARRSATSGYFAQFDAIRAWRGSHDRLGGITAPTLVIHGETDQLVPPENGRILARAIPNAGLVHAAATPATSS